MFFLWLSSFRCLVQAFFFSRQRSLTWPLLLCPNPSCRSCHRQKPALCLTPWPPPCPERSRPALPPDPVSTRTQAHMHTLALWALSNTPLASLSRVSTHFQQLFNSHTHAKQALTWTNAALLRSSRWCHREPGGLRELWSQLVLRVPKEAEPVFECK